MQSFIYQISGPRVFRRLIYDDLVMQTKKKKRGFYRPSSDGFIEKNDFRGQPCIMVHDFELEVFKQLMDYIHTGTVMLQSRTLLGLMNAADHYGLDELKMACIQFLDQAINTDTVCALLSSAEKYIQYKSTKILVQKMLEFVDHHAEVVLSLGSFATLPQHVVRIVLGREELLASEETKFEAAFRWCLRYIDEHQAVDLKTAFEPFVSKIEFHKIPVNHLMKKVKPAQIVDNSIILNALAYQADPMSIDAKKLVTSKRQYSGQSSPATSHKESSSESIPTIDSSPLQFRRVRSTGPPIQTTVTITDLEDGDDERERSGSVPPSDCLHPIRIFEVRGDSRLSQLSLASTESSNSLSSIPRSPVIGRSASSSSYHSNLSSEGRLDNRLMPNSHSENFVTCSTNSLV